MPLDDNAFTELAMGAGVQQMQPNMPNKHGLYVEFYMDAKPDSAATLEAGHPKFKDIPYLMIMVPGDKSSIIRRPIRTGQHPDHDNNRFHNEYVAFLQQEKQPLEGMPLSEWAQLTKSQVLELNHFGVKTVEMLAGLTDTNAQKGMGLLTLRNKAKAFLQASLLDAPLQKLQSELDTRDQTIAGLQQQMDEMIKEMKDLKKKK